MEQANRFEDVSAAELREIEGGGWFSGLVRCWHDEHGNGVAALAIEFIRAVAEVGGLDLHFGEIDALLGIGRRGQHESGERRRQQRDPVHCVSPCPECRKARHVRLWQRA